MAEVFLSAFLQVLFDRLTPHARELWSFVRREGLEEKLEQLVNTLRIVEAVLSDAEEKQLTDTAVELWLDDLKDWAYDTEDVLDDVATEALRQKIMAAEAERQNSANKFLNLVSPRSTLSAIKFKLNMGSKIEAITRRLEQISQRKDQLRLIQSVPGACTSNNNLFQATPTTSSPIEAVVYGRDEDKDKIVDLLLNDEQNCRVIAIVGMAGAGKTTLAQHVCKDQSVQQNFQIKAWVCVSYDFDIRRIMKATLEDLTSLPCELKELQPIQARLEGVLAGKRFLIVLDDVWNENYEKWLALVCAFRVGAAGSKIIITTRSLRIASETGSIPYDLMLLSDDACWSVFKEHAYKNSDIGTHRNWGVIRENVVDKCRGLPLAARILGGLLCSKTQDQWESMLNSKNWSLPVLKMSKNWSLPVLEMSKDWSLPGQSHGISPVLKMSYLHLPSNLKRCFAYSAIFPPYYEFTEKELVHLWMAEGFIQHSIGDNQGNEVVGGMYFRELVSRSMFHPSSNHGSQFVVHSLMHDVAQWAARVTYFLSTLERSDVPRTEKIRHFSYSRSSFDRNRFQSAWKHLQTFLPLPVDSWHNYLSNHDLISLRILKSLRVLSLSGYNIIELPNSVGDLKHLRYLNLSNTQIRILPQSTCSLYNLHILLLRNCVYLRELPSRIGNLINLGYLDITNAHSLKEMPVGLKKLKSLIALSDFILHKDNRCGLKELANFKDLSGTLRISNLEYVVYSEDAREANLTEKKLDVLELRWSSSFSDSRDAENEKCVLDMLQPHQNLKKLSIEFYSGKVFSSWLGDCSFSSIEHLKLENCKRCTSLPPLGQLSSLKALVIRGMIGVQCVGAEFYGTTPSKPFPSLEALTLEDMQEWLVWNEPETETFPCLCALSILNCPKLSGNLPKNLVSLEKLLIRGCENLSISFSRLLKVRNVDVDGCQVIACESTIDLGKVEHLVIGGDGCGELINSKLPCTVQYVELRGCRQLKRLPVSFHSLGNLRELHIDGCSSLKSLPGTLLSSALHGRFSISNCDNLHTLLDDFDGSSSSIIKVLSIHCCPSLERLSSGGDLPASLTKLTIQDCPKLEFVAKTLPVSLAYLRIMECPELKFVSQTFLHSPLTLPSSSMAASSSSLSVRDKPCSRLETILVFDCKKFQSLPKDLHKLRHLDKIHLESCPNFISFPEGGLRSTELRELIIHNCERLEDLPNGIHKHHSLKKLWITDCPNINFVPDEGFLTELGVAGVEVCRPLVQWGLHRLQRLKSLTIRCGCPDMQDLGRKLPSYLKELSVEAFPNLIRLPNLPLLSKLSIKDCPMLISLPNLLQCLERLDIINCPKLDSLPKEGLPDTLLELYITGCPILRKRCKREKGKDWPKIADIPCVEIDGKFVYDLES